MIVIGTVVTVILIQFTAVQFSKSLLSSRRNSFVMSVNVKELQIKHNYIYHIHDVMIKT